MAWIVLTLLAILARGGLGLATKLQTNHVRISPITQTILFMSLGAILVCIITPFIGGFSFSGASRDLPAIIGIVATQAIGNVLFFKGQNELEAGTAQIVISSVLIWSTLFSVMFLHSRFSVLQTAGIAVMLIAILLAQYKKGQNKLSAPIIYILAAAAVFALFQVISARVSDTMNTGAYLLYLYAGTALALFLIRPRQFLSETKTLLRKKYVALRYIGFASTMSVLFIVFSYLAFRHAPHKGIVVVLLPSQVIVSVLLGIIILRERNAIIRKLTATVLAVLAAAAIKS